MTLQQKEKQHVIDKELLIRDIHHRVKNNMNVIISLLNLQSNNSKSEEVKSQFNLMENRIISMSKTHEMLYKSENLIDIDFSDQIHLLANELNKSHAIQTGNLHYTINAANIKLGMDRAIPCSLLLTELLTNSFKHAFLDGRKGKIAIDFKKDQDNNYLLIISDNGIGLPDDFDIKKINSLGLTLVDALTKQLKGEMKITGKKGTKVTITFPGE